MNESREQNKFLYLKSKNLTSETLDSFGRIRQKIPMEIHDIGIQSIIKSMISSTYNAHKIENENEYKIAIQNTCLFFLETYTEEKILKLNSLNFPTMKILYDCIELLYTLTRRDLRRTKPNSEENTKIEKLKQAIQMINETTKKSDELLTNMKLAQ